MSNEYLRFTEAPKLVMSYPDCSACCVEVEHDGDGWLCPSCGTTWDTSAGEDDKGTLFEDWSGEAAEGPESSLDDAWKARWRA